MSTAGRRARPEPDETELHGLRVEVLELRDELAGAHAELAESRSRIEALESDARRRTRNRSIVRASVARLGRRVRRAVPGAPAHE